MVKKDIVVINPKSNIALCTLWSKKEFILDKIGEDRKYINIAGTLYTSYGVNYLLQTLGEHNEINTLIVFGSDRSTSGKTLVELFSEVKGVIFSKEEIDEIIRNVKVIDLRKAYEEGNFEILKNIICSSYSENTINRRRIQLNIIEETAKSFPYPVSGFSLFDTSIFRLWVKILNQILKFGFEKPSEYKEPQLEILNMSAVLGVYGNEYHLEEKFFKYLKREEFEKHVRDLLSGEKPDDVEYTYGYRLFSHGIAGNQIERMIEYLSKRPYSRRAISIVIDPRSDFDSEYPPCIGVVQGIISGDYYNHTVYIRSNDMFRGWPVNMYGQYMLAKYIVEKINKRTGTDYKLGTVTTHSFSAHLYQHDWKIAKNLVEENKWVFSYFVKDPKGNFVIYHENDSVVVEFRTDEELIEKKTFKNFQDAYNYIRSLNLMEEHAVYLGKELFRAFDYLKNKKEYIQDKV